MTRKRIAVDLASAPSMLRSILAETLASIPDAEILELDRLPPDVALDAVLVCADQPSLDAIEREQTDRLIAVSVAGDTVTIHRPGSAPYVLSDASPDCIRDLLIGPLPRRRGLIGWFRGVFCEAPARDRSPRMRAASSADPLSSALGQLAARILASRGDQVAVEGPGAELRALADYLAANISSKYPPLPGLERLARVFDLTDPERDFVLLASLVEVDPRAARMVALLNDHMGKPRPTVGLIADLGMAPGDIATRLGSDGTLRRFGVLTLTTEGPLSARQANVPPDVWRLVIGATRNPVFAPQPVASDLLDQIPAPKAFAQRLKNFAQEISGVVGPAPAVAILGAADSGRQTIANALAGQLRRHVLHVAGGTLAEMGGAGALAREVRLNNAAVVFTDPEALPADQWSESLKLINAPLFLVAQPGQYGALALASERPILSVTAPERDVGQRLRFWRAYASGVWPDDSLRNVSERFDHGPRAIACAGRIARIQAQVESRSVPTPHDLLAACDRLRDIRFDGAAERLPCPYAADDIVLSAETRAELNLAVAWARHGHALFGPSGAGAPLRPGTGLACLFSGPPGTGKTMAAQVIARQVDYPLYRIDLSKVVDKFIGESEKRLAAVFNEAERSRVALFFDEADALFGKRTEVRDSHDRYANITIDYLLQRLDNFDGLAILATNLAGNIDDAFLRRVRIRAEFAAPGPAERRMIWEKLLPPTAERDSDIDIPRLADPFEIVGGEIRNVIYTAHLLSAEDGKPLAMRHCVRGLWRELEKIGRMSERDRFGSWQSVLEGPAAATTLTV